MSKITWIDDHGCQHEVSAPYAAELLCQLFNEWPGGLDEINASLAWHKKRIAELEAAAPGAPQQEASGDEPIASAYRGGTPQFGYATAITKLPGAERLPLGTTLLYARAAATEPAGGVTDDAPTSPIAAIELVVEKWEGNGRVNADAAMGRIADLIRESNHG